MFQSFIQRRTEASDVHCLLFDECLNEYYSSQESSGSLMECLQISPQVANGAFLDTNYLWTNALQNSAMHVKLMSPLQEKPQY